VLKNQPSLDRCHSCDKVALPATSRVSPSVAGHHTWRHVASQLRDSFLE